MAVGRKSREDHESAVRDLIRAGDANPMFGHGDSADEAAARSRATAARSVRDAAGDHSDIKNVGEARYGHRKPQMEDKAMAKKADIEDELDDEAIEPHGSTALRGLHQRLHATHRDGMLDLARMEPDSASHAHMREHLGGVEKAMKAIQKAHGKCYKGVEPIPDDYGGGDMETKSVEDLEDAGKKRPLGERPEDEEEGLDDNEDASTREREERDDKDKDDDMDDDDKDKFEKALVAMERQYGLR